MDAMLMRTWTLIANTGYHCWCIVLDVFVELDVPGLDAILNQNEADGSGRLKYRMTAG